MTGKAIAKGAPVPESMLAGPDDPMQLPKTFMLMMQWRAGSIGLQGPSMRVHQPDLPVTGWFDATY